MAVRDGEGDGMGERVMGRERRRRRGYIPMIPAAQGFVGKSGVS
jgi:hypothetical protein